MRSLKIAEPQPRKILRKAAVRERTGLSDASIWRYERDNKFPKRIVLSESGLVGWYADEIDGWVHDRVRAGGRRPIFVAPAKPRQVAPTVSGNGADAAD